MHLKSLWPWHWRTVRDTGVHVYETCSCGFRRVCRFETSGLRHGDGEWVPVDYEWLETGEWTPMPTLLDQSRKFWSDIDSTLCDLDERLEAVIDRGRKFD